MYYGNAMDDFVGLADLAAVPRGHGRRHRGEHAHRHPHRHPHHPLHPRHPQHPLLRGLADFLEGLGAARAPRVKALPLTVPVPGYAYKKWACKAGGGVRQNQLKAEAYCGTQGFMAHVTSCAPFQYYCDQTLPVRVRGGRHPAPPGLIGGGGIAPTPCPAGSVMNAAGQCQYPGPFGGGPEQLCADGSLPLPGQLCPLPGQPGWCGNLIPPGSMMPSMRVPCPAPSGAGGVAPQCPPGAMFDPGSNSCVSALPGGGFYTGPAPSPYQGYAYGAPPSPYGGPLLTPIDEGGAATMDMTAYAEAPSDALPGIPVGYGGPMLTPISEGLDYTEGGPSDQTNLVPFNQAAGGMPSPVGATQAAAQCQQEAAAPPTSDAYGPLTPIKIVCAPSQAVMPQSGGPFPGVQNPDVIAQQELSTMTGLGRWIG